jgi:hypothetical protein
MRFVKGAGKWTQLWSIRFWALAVVSQILASADVLFPSMKAYFSPEVFVLTGIALSVAGMVARVIYQSQFPDHL